MPCRESVSYALSQAICGLRWIWQMAARRARLRIGEWGMNRWSCASPDKQLPRGALNAIQRNIDELLASSWEEFHIMFWAEAAVAQQLLWINEGRARSFGEVASQRRLGAQDDSDLGKAKWVCVAGLITCPSM